MTSRLYNYLLNCRKNNTLTEAQLENAVNKGYLTEEEAKVIRNS